MNSLDVIYKNFKTQVIFRQAGIGLSGNVWKLKLVKEKRLPRFECDQAKNFKFREKKKGFQKKRDPVSRVPFEISILKIELKVELAELSSLW